MLSWKKFRWTVAALFLAGGLSVYAQTPVGSVVATTVSTDPANGNQYVTFDLSTGGALRVSPYASDVVRVRFHWDGIWSKEEPAIDKPFGEWPSFAATFQDDGNVYRIITPQVEVEVVKSPSVQVHFKSPQGFYLSRDGQIQYDTTYDPVSDPTYRGLHGGSAFPLGYKLKNSREMPADEAYFGLGSYGGPMNRRGTDIQYWNADAFQFGEFKSPLYLSLPFVYGLLGDSPGRPSTAWGLFFNNPARPVFRMGTEQGDRFSFEAGDGQIDYFFFAGGASHRMKEVIGRFAELTGAPAFLPKWGYGYQMSRYSYDNQGWIEWLTQEFRNQDIPLDAVYVDIDYMDQGANDGNYRDNKLHQLTFNSGIFPDPAGMIDHAEQRGVKLVPLIEPWLTIDDPMYDQAHDAGHFVKDYDYNQVVTPLYFGDVSWLDFTSTPARDWWRAKVLNFLNQYPFAGIWNDLNEPADKHVQTGENVFAGDSRYWLDGRYADVPWDSRQFHINEKNVYAIRECSLTYDILKTKDPEKRPFVLSRAGFPGIQKYALGWSGDNASSWDHARFNIRLGVGVMITGQANYGHDVGGFIGDPTGEFVTRWHEWGMFNPFFRQHYAGWNANNREPWLYGEPYTSHMRNIIKFRYQLMPYLYTLAYDAHTTGVPMNTPTVMHFQQDAQTHFQNEYDFMVGDFLLVSPVYQQGGTVERWTYLPAGSDWYNYYTSARIGGGSWASQQSPVGQVPLYVRAGAILPMGPPMAHANQFVPDFLDLHAWPAPVGFPSSFTLYEDDGESFAYQGGGYARTPMTLERTPSGFNFSLGAREGSFDPGARSFYLKVRDVDDPQNVTLNGVSIPRDAALGGTASFTYDGAGGLLTVKIPDTGAAQTLIAQEALVSGVSFSTDPRDCAPLTVTYYAENGPLQGISPVYMQIRFDDGDWTRTVMSNAGSDTWTYTVDPIPGKPAGATVWFENTNGSTLDNRDGANWSTPIRDCDPPVGPRVVEWDPQFPDGCGVDVTIRYYPNEGILQGASQVNLYIGRNGWTAPETLPMTQTGTYWAYTYAVPDDTAEINFVLNDGAGTWDNNGGNDWTVAVSNCGGGGPLPTVSTVPHQPVGCDPITIRYNPIGRNLAPADQVYIHIGRNGWQDVIDPNPAMTLADGIWSYTYAPPPNTEEINFVFNNGIGTWDNNGGQDWNVVVTDCDDPPPPPAGLAITNPVSAAIEVAYEVDRFTLQGIAEDMAGLLAWSNALTGASGSIPVADPWTIPDVDLAVGANAITVRGTTAGEVTIATNAVDRGANYGEEWLDGSNQGVGFGPWSFAHTTDGSTHFAGAFIGDPGVAEIAGMSEAAFGFYANPAGSAANALVARTFSGPLAAGDVFQFDLGLNWDSAAPDSSRGFNLLAGAAELVNINMANDAAITINGDTLFANYGFQVMTLHFEVVADGSIRVWGTGRDGVETYDQVLAVPPGAPTGFAFYFNATEAGNANRQMYVDNLLITAPGGDSGVSTSATVTITRLDDGGATDSNGDGVPDSWYEQYGYDPTLPGLASQVGPNGYPLGASFVMQLDPSDTETVAFRMLDIDATTGEIEWQSVGLRRYMVEYRDGASDDWQPLVVEDLAADGQATTVDPPPVDPASRSTVRSYRVRFLGMME